MRLIVTGTPTAAEPNGDLILHATDDGGKEHDVVLPAAYVHGMIKDFQKAQVRRAATGGTAVMSEMTILAASPGHQDQESQMMVSTDQMGWVVLKASPEMLRHLRDVIAKVLTYQSSRAGGLN